MTLTMYDAAAGETGCPCLRPVCPASHTFSVRVCVCVSHNEMHTLTIIVCALGSGCNVCKCVFHSDENVILQQHKLSTVGTIYLMYSIIF